MAEKRSLSSPKLALRISELEKASGFSRTTIYYYVREGLLPPPQKAGRTSAYYGQEHLRRLAHIRRLKRRRLTLSDIERFIREEAKELPAEEADLVAERALATRRQILQVATRTFATKGYGKTRIDDICTEIGIAPVTLYRHFPTKRALFLEVVAVFADESFRFVEPLIADEPDYVRRNMMRTAGWIGLRALSPDMLTFVRAEALGKDPELHRLVRSMYWELLEPMAEEVRELGSRTKDSLPATELVAYAIQGIEEALVMRLSWDNQYSLRDYFSTMLFVFLVVEAVYSGTLDLTEKQARYATLVEHLAESPPLSPPIPNKG